MTPMKVLVVGHGAREHAIAKKLAQEDMELVAAMSRLNPGIAALSESVEVFDINDPAEYERFRDADLAFVGPEAPLAAGVSDRLWELGVPVVGARKALARLEWSKAYTRQVVQEHGISGNPEFAICRSAEEVDAFLKDHEEVAVKPDVLTGGKGVRVTGDHLNSVEETRGYALERVKQDGLVVIEEKLKGREFTLQAFTDGKRVEVMPLVRDFKRAYDGDKGPNTGSMGSFSCPDHGMPDLPLEAVEKGIEIMERTVEALSGSVGLYQGVLYGGFMNTERGVYLIEYNARFGDPEAINVLALLETPLSEVGYGIVEGRLPETRFAEEATVCVYLTPEGYPVNPLRDQPIEVGETRHSEIYYASVYDDNGVVKTTGSRSIALLGRGGTVSEAREKVYSDVGNIKGRLHYRTDIAAPTYLSF
ncbi:phosphoribosylamine--glycine ligase [Candidatus Bathyarchaeota archaeon]|nr:phosphoribosylamine--glycine ligase [Candidatus Bathyarchaeota archaeon]